jgi:nicotinamidase-related amidase
MKTGTRIFFFFISMIFLQNLGFSQPKKYDNEKYVIVLDVQQYWTDNALSKQTSKEMVKSVNTVIEKTNPEKVIYVKTLFASKVLSISFRGIKVDSIFAIDFDKNLKLVNNKVFEKKTGDAFSVKEMLDLFQVNGSKEIIVVGLLAERCVFKTALGGKSRGFDITLISEAVGGKSEKSKAKTFKKLKKEGVNIVSLTDWLLFK